MITFKNECPCKNCVYYIKGKQHPNPNAYDLHYCEVKGGETMKTKNQLFYSDLFNTNNVQIFYKYYGTAHDEFIISQLKAGKTQSQIAKELEISQPSISRCVSKIINHYTKFCKCVGEITADRLKGEQNY